MSQPQSQSLADTHTPVAAGSMAAIAAPRVVIERVSPSVDGGRFPAKGIVGQCVLVEADIFLDGHDKPGARVVWHSSNELHTHSETMRPVGNDRWQADFTPSVAGSHSFT